MSSEVSDDNNDPVLSIRKHMAETGYYQQPAVVLAIADRVRNRDINPTKAKMSQAREVEIKQELESYARYIENLLYPGNQLALQAFVVNAILCLHNLLPRPRTPASDADEKDDQAEADQDLDLGQLRHLAAEARDRKAQEKFPGGFVETDYEMMAFIAACQQMRGGRPNTAKNAGWSERASGSLMEQINALEILLRRYQ